MWLVRSASTWHRVIGASLGRLVRSASIGHGATLAWLGRDRRCSVHSYLPCPRRSVDTGTR